MKILMVCLGNICRSPMAEGILRAKLPDTFTVDSAGIANYHVNDKPDKRAIEVCKKNNINISDLRGRQFTSDDFDDFDIIYVMDQVNYSDVIFKVKKEAQKKKVRLIMDENLNPDNTEKIIPDPYYGDIEDFERIFHQLDTICAIIAGKVLSRLDDDDVTENINSSIGNSHSSTENIDSSTENSDDSVKN